MSTREEHIYDNLHQQIVKIAKHNRQGAFKTKERYFSGVETFCRFAAEEFGLQKFANISDKHIAKYVSNMQARELGASTIKTNLSAIRFFHDKCDAKFTLSGNEKFGLERRHFGGIDKSWSKDEYKSFLNLCENKGKDRIASVAILARNEGLRIHEAFKIDRNQAEKAIRTNVLHVIGKGGKERDVPLSRESVELLQVRIRDVERGQKLFVNEGEKTHLIIKQVQNFINRNRVDFQVGTHKGHSITYHGLRHLFSQEQYLRCISEGMNDYKARLAVSKLLGHERDEVTRIYLAK